MIYSGGTLCNQNSTPFSVGIMGQWPGGGGGEQTDRRFKLESGSKPTKDIRIFCWPSVNEDTTQEEKKC